MPDHAPLSSTTPNASAAPANSAGQDVTPLVRALERVRSRAWALLVLSSVASVLGIAIVSATALAVADYYLRTPSSLRIGLLVIGLVALWTIIRSRISPAVSFKPSLTEVALRVEKSQEGKAAGLQGALASGLELASEKKISSVDSLRASRAVNQAIDSFAKSPRSARILKPGYAGKALAAALGLALPAIILSAARPDLSRIAALRIFTPWSDAAWPKRTLLADLTAVTVHSSEASLPLRAIVHHQATQTPDVWVRFRTIIDGKQGPWRSELLTAQGKQAKSIDGLLEGDLVERLIEPSAGAPDSPSSTAAVTELEYRFQSTDDQTALARIRLVNPPVVLRSEIDIVPPAYATASTVPGSAASYVSGPQPVTEGTSVATIGPVLAGSSVSVRATLNKPVLPPPAGAASMFVGPAPRDARITPQASDWNLSFTPESSVRLVMLPQDEFGIASPSETVIGVSVVADQPPTAAVLTPSQDEGVLPTAQLSIEGEGRDDVALRYASLEYQLAPAAAGSLGASVPPGPPVAMLRADAAATGGPLGSQARISTTLDLGSLGVKPGDEITLSTLAKDVYDRDGEQHEAVRSSGRKLLVISEAQFVEQMQNELAAVRDAAIRLDQDQAELVSKAAQQTPTQRATSQRSITQRLTPPAELVDRLARRVERNQLADQAMTGMLKDAAETLRAAADSSDQASQSLTQADRKSAAGEDPEKDAAAAQEAQKQVREELASLVGMLDRGQDGWTVRREVQRLLDQQRDLTQQTREATSRVAGKPAESLTPAERQKLSALSQAQQDLSARTQEAIQQLDQRASALEKTDPGQSAAMKQAAEKGREEKVSENQRQAAQAITENRSQSANELQEKAAEAMEQMLQRFDQSERQRDDALRRVLAELADQIRGLIVQQKAQLEGLAKAGGVLAGSGLDVPLISLHSATLGLVDSVAEGPAAAREVAEPLRTAAEAQSLAIQELRRSEPQVDPAREHEQASLEALNNALELSRKLEQQAQQRDQGRQRAEILESYRAALEEQSAIGVDTDPLIGKTLDRRLRATARALGEREESLRATLQELRKKNTDIENTIVFSYAHDQIDALLRKTAETLKGGSAPRAVHRDQDSVVSLLKSLVQAMASSQQEDPFREGADEGDNQEQGGDGGAGGAKPKLIPDVAELQGLRGLQEIAARRTRAASDAGSDADAGEISEIQKFQRDIADRAKTLLERLSNPGTPDKGPDSNPLAPQGQPDEPQPDDHKPMDEKAGAG